MRTSVDLRPCSSCSGLVDLHAHLPQLPNAGLGFGLDLLTWLDRYIFPLERSVRRPGTSPSASRRPRSGPSRPPARRRSSPTARSTRRRWTRAFRAAEAHGIRAILGKVMMDRLDVRPDDRAVDDPRALAARVGGPVRRAGTAPTTAACGYAVTPRFAISCSADLLRESAALAARRPGRGGRPTSPRTRARSPRSRACSPRPATTSTSTTAPAGSARGRSSPTRSTSPIGSSRGSSRPDARRALPGVEPVPRLRDHAAGALPRGRAAVGLGSDVAAGPDPSIFSVMRVGAYAQAALRTVAGRRRAAGRSSPLDWLRLGTLDGARVARPRRSDRLARGGQGGRPHRRRPEADPAAAATFPTTRRAWNPRKS